MSNAARKWFVLSGALALAGGFVLVRLFAGGPTVADDGSGGVAGTGVAELRGSSTSFSIAGRAAEPISPGVLVPLDLEFTNSHDSPMSVTDLTVSVQRVSAPQADDFHPCAVGDFAVEQASRSLEINVPAGAPHTLTSLGLPRAEWPQVAMLNRSVNQDGCKGASLTLDYTASGTLVN